MVKYNHNCSGKRPPAPVIASKKYRVIMDGDIACEADDLYAVSFALMSDKLDIVGLCSEQWGTEWSDTSMEDGYQELLKLTKAMGVTDIPICRGAVNAIRRNEHGEYEYEMNEASQLIIDEAMKEDERPLVIGCTGTMTNVAIAYLACPEIADKLYVVGNILPHGAWDFNLGNDCHACNILMDSPVEWYLSKSRNGFTYKASMTKLYQVLSKCGAVGEYLWNRTLYAQEQLTYRIGKDIERGYLGRGLSNFELRGYVPNGEIFELNDMEVVARLLSMGYASFEMEDACHILSIAGNLDPDYVPVRKVKCFATGTEVNCFMDDFFAKLEYYYGEK